MNLSYLPRMLARVRVRAVVVGVLVGGAVIAVVVYVRTMSRPGYVPQIDDPLRRGTDLDPLLDGVVDRQQRADALRSDAWPLPVEVDRCPYCGAVPFHVLCDDDEPAPRIDDGDGWAPGALLHLAHAADETTARYWLAMYARRGATWEQQRTAWDEWTAAHRGNVHYLPTDRPEEHP